MPLEPGTEEGSLNRVTGKAHWGFGLALPSLHRRILRTREYQEVTAVTETPFPPFKSCETLPERPQSWERGVRTQTLAPQL